MTADDVAESVGNVRVTMAHFEEALGDVGASVTEETRQQYQEVEEEFAKSDFRAEAESSAPGAFQ